MCGAAFGGAYLTLHPLGRGAFLPPPLLRRALAEIGGEISPLTITLSTFVSSSKQNYLTFTEATRRHNFLVLDYQTIDELLQSY